MLLDEFNEMNVSKGDSFIVRDKNWGIIPGTFLEVQDNQNVLLKDQQGKERLLSLKTILQIVFDPEELY